MELMLGQNVGGFDVDRLLVNIKLDMPLVRDQVDNFRNKIVKSPNHIDVQVLLHEGITHNRLLRAATNEMCYADLLTRLLYSQSRLIPSEQINLLKRINKISNQVTIQQVKFVSTIMKEPQQWDQKTSMIISHLVNDHNYQNLYHAVLMIQKIQKNLSKYMKPIKLVKDSYIPIPNQIVDYKKSVNKFDLYLLEDSFIVFNTAVCFVKIEENEYLLPRNYILLIHNKLHDLLSVYINSHFMKSQVLDDNFPKTVLTHVKYLSKMLMEDCEHYFSIAKSLEGLANAKTIKSHEIWRNDTYLNDMMEDLEESLTKCKGKLWIHWYLSQNDAVINELSCLSKILGHPIMVAERGVVKTWTRSTELTTIDPTMVQEVVNEAKLDVIESFIDRHGHWPPIEMNHKASLAIRSAYNLQEKPTADIISETFKTNILKTMEDIKFLPIFKFKSPNTFLDLLKDTAISCTKFKAITDFINVHLQEELEQGRHTTKDMIHYLSKNRPLERLLIRYIATEHPDQEIKEFIAKTIADLEYFDAHKEHLFPELYVHYVIKLCLKERELKIDGRCFGAMSFALRMANVVYEMSIAKWLMLYSNFQGLKLNEIETIRKIQSFTGQQKLFQDYFHLMISFDAQGWCSYWRDRSIRPVMKETFDKIYDCPIFSNRMLMFEKSLFYLSSSEKIFHWDGQQGGIEGLCQYLWTFIYHYQAKVCIKELCSISNILVKGDDLRVTMLIKRDQMEGLTEKQYVDKVKRIFQEKMGQFGHLIKVRESYCSSACLSFNKMFFIREVMLSSIFRKAQKIHGYTNSMIPTLEEQIGSIFSNAHSSSLYGFSTVGLYFTSCSFSMMLILQDPKYKKLPDSMLSTLIQTPGVAGGFPVLLLHNMLAREESDHLTTYLEWLKFIGLIDGEAQKYGINMILQKGRKLNDPSSFLMLLADPYSLNQNIPMTAQSALRSRISEHLEDIVVNKQLIMLSRLVKKFPTETLVKIFLDDPVWHGKLFSLLYSCHPAAVFSSFIRRFESAKSIFDLFVLTFNKRHAYRIFRSAINFEHQRQKWRIDAINGLNLNPELFTIRENLYNWCSTKLADELRRLSWGRNIVTITHPSLFHFTTLIRDDKRQVGDRCWSFEILRAQDCYDILPSDLYQGRYSSDFNPTYSSSTSKKLLSETPLKRINSSNMIISKMIRLLEIDAMSKPLQIIHPMTKENSLSNLIETLMNMYHPNASKELLPFRIDRLGGCLTHRLPAPKYKSTVSLNVTPNIYLQYKYNTNTHSVLSGTSKNFSVNFNGLFLSCIPYICFDLQFQNRLNYYGNYLINTIKPEDLNCNCWNEIHEPGIRFKFTSEEKNELLGQSQIIPLELIAIEEARELIQEAIHDINEPMSKFFLKDDDLQKLDDSERSKVLQQSVLLTYLDSQSRQHKILTTTYKMPLTRDHYDMMMGLSHMNPLLKLSVKHFKRISFDNITECLLYHIQSFCFFSAKTDLPLEWLETVLPLINPSEVPWFLLLTDLKNSKMLYPYINYLNLLTKIPIPNDSYFSEYEALRFIHRCLGKLMMSSLNYQPSVYFVFHEPINMIYRKCEMYYITKLWYKLETKLASISEFEHNNEIEIIGALFPHIHPFKTAEDMIDIITNTEDNDYNFTVYKLDSNCQIDTPDLESEDMDLIYHSWLQLIHHINTAPKFFFVRKLISMNCQVDQHRLHGCHCLRHLSTLDFKGYLHNLMLYYEGQIDKIHIIRIDIANAVQQLETLPEIEIMRSNNNLVGKGGNIEMNPYNKKSHRLLKDWLEVTGYIHKTNFSEFKIREVIIPEIVNHFPIDLRAVTQIQGGQDPETSSLIDIFNKWRFTVNNDSCCLLYNDSLGILSYNLLKEFDKLNVIWNCKINHVNPVQPLPLTDPLMSHRFQDISSSQNYEDDIATYQTLISVIRETGRQANLTYFNDNDLFESNRITSRIYHHIILSALYTKPAFEQGYLIIGFHIQTVKDILPVVTKYIDSFFSIEFCKPIGSGKRGQIYMVATIKKQLYLEKLPILTEEDYKCDLISETLLTSISYTIKKVNEFSNSVSTNDFQLALYSTSVQLFPLIVKSKTMENTLSYIISELRLSGNSKSSIARIKEHTKIEINTSISTVFTENVNNALTGRYYSGYPDLTQLRDLFLIRIGFLVSLGLGEDNIYNQIERFIEELIVRYPHCRIYQFDSRTKRFLHFSNAQNDYGIKALYYGIYLSTICYGIENYEKHVSSSDKSHLASIPAQADDEYYYED